MDPERYPQRVPDGLDPPGRDAERALLNILEDYVAERERFRDAQRATLNVLEDSSSERVRLELAQRAFLNLLDDAGEERTRSGETQRALLNILADTSAEEEELQRSHRALVNILDDLEADKRDLDRMNLTLRIEVAERRRTEEKLEARTRDLDRSVEDLRLFAVAASHDLAEPLRAISGPITLVARRYEGRLDPESDQLIAFAVDGCERMQKLIDDLLAFSRVGQHEVTMEQVDAGAVLGAVLASLRPAVEEARAVVTSDPLPVVAADTTQLTQILQNLISNAMKFTAPGVAPRVHVGAERAGEQWRFTVTDNGIGVPPRHRDRVFGLFKRLHTREEYPGTGLGLALVEKIVEQHGGRTGVEDAPGGAGSRFWFTLPASRGERP